MLQVLTPKLTRQRLATKPENTKELAGVGLGWSAQVRHVRLMRAA